MVITKKIIVPAGQKEEELELTVEAEANQYIPFALDEVNLDFQILGPAPNNPDEVEVLIAASRKEKVEDRVAIAEAAGLKPRVMDVESYATQEAFGLIAPSLPANGRDQNIALVDIGAHVTHFYVLRNNQFLFSRDQAFGGNQLTHDIQRAFNLSPDEAESAKKNQGLPENYDTDVLQPFMETLALEITRALQFFFTSTSYNQVDQIVLAGGCAAAARHRRAGRQARRRRDGHRQSVRQHADVRPHPAAAARAGRADAADRLRPGAAELRMNGRRPHQPAAAPRAEAAGAPAAVRLAGGAARGRWRSASSGSCTSSSRRRSTTRTAATRCSRPRSRSSTSRSRRSTSCASRSQAVLARKQVVETLQANRSEAVHLLDQIVRQLPDGIYLRSMKQTGTEDHAGRLRAVERARVDADAQHRGSPWLSTPELVEIKLVPSPGDARAHLTRSTSSRSTSRSSALAPAEAQAAPAAATRAGSAGRAAAKPAKTEGAATEQTA